MPLSAPRNLTTAAPLFAYRVGDRPAGSVFDRLSTTALQADAAASRDWSPRWLPVDNATGFFCVVGDSIVVGYNAAQPEDSHIEKALRLIGSPAWNIGMICQSSARLSSATTYLDLLGLFNTYAAPYCRNQRGIFYLMAGTNDGKLDGASAGTIATRRNAICTAMRLCAPLAKIVVSTHLPRENNASWEGVRATDNATIIANAGGLWDYVSNWGNTALPMSANAAASTSLTYYGADQVHPNNVGQAVGAGLLATQLTTARAAAGI